MTGLNPVIKKNTPVINSTIGYRQLIFLWQNRHFAESKIKDSRGMLSDQPISFLHRGQMLRPCQNFGAPETFNLKIKTLRKLPILKPSKNKKRTTSIAPYNWHLALHDLPHYLYPLSTSNLPLLAFLIGHKSHTPFRPKDTYSQRWSPWFLLGQRAH